MTTSTRDERRGPSLWAVILILVGTVWLLAQANIITGANLSVLFRMWPILLIGIGLELLIGRQSRVLSTLIIFATIAILLLLMIVGPSMGLAANTEVETAQYSEPVEDAESAQITVSVGVGDLNVRVMDDSADLFKADIRYIGDIQYEAEGNTQKVITLENDSSGNWFGFFNLFNAEPARWDIGINPNVPAELTLSTGTGSASLDLSRIQLTNVNVNSGTGGITLTLPAIESESYNARVSLGTGGATINLEEGIAVNLRVSSGTGGTTINVPDNAPVRLVAQTGTGGINVPSGFQRVGGEAGSFVGSDGVWETASYADASADQRIDIQFSGGTGGLNVR